MEQLKEKKTSLISKNTSYFFRGIAAIMVIFSHFFEWSEAQVGNPALAKFVMALGDPGVAIFFFLSGYAIHKSYGDKKTDRTYIIKRLKAVYIPYLVISILKEIYRGNLLQMDLKGVWELLKGGSFWFITVLLIIYIAYYFAGKLPKYRILVMTIFIIDLSLLYRVLGYQIFWYDANWAFAFGLIVAKYESKIPKVANGFSIDIKDIVFVFLGKLSLYIYLLHGFIYLDFINSPTVYNHIHNYYVQLFLALLIIVFVSFIADRMIGWIYKFMGRVKRNEKENKSSSRSFGCCAEHRSIFGSQHICRRKDRG